MSINQPRNYRGLRENSIPRPQKYGKDVHKSTLESYGLKGSLIPRPWRPKIDVHNLIPKVTGAKGSLIPRPQESERDES